MEELSNYEVVTFTNISDDDFVGMFGGKEVKFAPHSVSQLPKFLAKHYAGQLAIKILMSQGKEWGNDSPNKAEMIGKILGNASVVLGIDNTGLAMKVEEPKEKEFEDLEDEKADELSKDASFLCTTCGKTTKTEAALKAHVTRMHKSN